MPHLERSEMAIPHLGEVASHRPGRLEAQAGAPNKILHGGDGFFDPAGLLADTHFDIEQQKITEVTRNLSILARRGPRQRNTIVRAQIADQGATAALPQSVVEFADFLIAMRTVIVEAAVA